jgi:glucokinase
MSRILAGDIGGTQLRLGVFRVGAGELSLEVRRSCPSARFEGLEAAVEGLFADRGIDDVASACFGVAGAVVDNRSQLTNLDWEIDGGRVAEQLGIPRVELVNDLVATGFGLDALGPEDFLTLRPGTHEAGGTTVLVGVGTGLGVAFLAPCGDLPLAMPSEGGHADFAPRDPVEWRLLEYLRRRLGGRVSVERVVSGPGLLNIYQFFAEEVGEPTPTEVGRRMATEDPSQVVAEAGLDGSCRACARALELFASACGALAGNMALMGAAAGGVYLTGGVAAKLLPRLDRERLLAAYLDKGRLRPFLESVPLQVVLREDAGFLGAARRAAALLEAGGRPAAETGNSAGGGTPGR